MKDLKFSRREFLRLGALSVAGVALLGRQSAAGQVASTIAAQGGKAGLTNLTL